MGTPSGEPGPFTIATCLSRVSSVCWLHMWSRAPLRYEGEIETRFVFIYTGKLPGENVCLCVA